MSRGKNTGTESGTVMCAPMRTEHSRTMFIPGQPFWPFRLEIPHNLSLLFPNKPLYLYLSFTAATSKVVAESLVLFIIFLLFPIFVRGRSSSVVVEVCGGNFVGLWGHAKRVCLDIFLIIFLFLLLCLPPL
jgi:hypothetical protein